MYRIILAGVLTAVFMGALCVHATPKYQDILDTPAIRSHLAQKGLLNGIAWAGKRLVSVGQRGNIIYSDDRGKSWIQADVPVSSDLVSVYFPTEKKGWAVGHDGVVLKSEDSGATWVKQFDGRAAARVMKCYYTAHPPAGEEKERLLKEVDRFVGEGPDKPFLDVWFEDENSGFIVGAFNLIFSTSDGGKNWKPWLDRTENPELLHLYSVKRIGCDIYIAGEQGLVMRFDRTAGKFQRMETPYPGTFFGVTGKAGSVVVYGMRGNVYRSADRGETWSKIETGIPVGLMGAAVAEDGRIILVSQAGNVLVSRDGGASFKTAKMEIPCFTSAVAALNGDAVVMTGLNGVQHQTIK